MSTTGFFTGGVPAERYIFPHPRIAFPTILLIRRVLIRAFAILRENKFDLTTAKEDEVTSALRSVVENNLRQSGEVPGFNKRTFEFVQRQAQWENYSRTVVTKTPDVFVKLRDDETNRRPVLSEFEGLFIEAKPVDNVHPVGAKYCDDGLIRFVRGDYAWAMQDAVMLAYVRDGKSIAKHLIPAMNEPSRKKKLPTLQPPEASTSPAGAACAEAEAIHTSIHPRGFEWPDGKGQATAITVYHLWYQCIN